MALFPRWVLYIVEGRKPNKSTPQNPFAFRFSSNVNAGNLMVAASQLSLESMESSKIIRQSYLT